MPSYRPTQLLPIIISKLYDEHIPLRRVMVLVQERRNYFKTPVYQIQSETLNNFQQIHSDIENKEICNAMFLDIDQAFDKVWHGGLLDKIKLYAKLGIYFDLNTLKQKVIN